MKAPRLYRAAVRDLRENLNDMKPAERIAVISYTARIFQVSHSQLSKDIRGYL